MTTKFMNKCRKFASEIKNQSGSIFSDTIKFNMFEDLNRTYLYVLRCKRNAIESNFDEPYFKFTAKNENLNEVQTYLLRPSHNLTNDQILKIIISVKIFYLSHQKIKSIICR